MRSAQTFWRYHARPRPARLPRVAAWPEAAPGSVQQVRQLMKAAAARASDAGFPAPLFPFEAADVVAIYTRKKDEGDGLWFGLIDGRIYAATGEPDTCDPDAYEQSA